jgi:hypothetical protein
MGWPAHVPVSFSLSHVFAGEVDTCGAKRMQMMKASLPGQRSQMAGRLLHLQRLATALQQASGAAFAVVAGLGPHLQEPTKASQTHYHTARMHACMIKNNTGERLTPDDIS